MISLRALSDYFHTGFTFYTGGGGSSGPTTSTVNQTNIPEYAQPYVEGMLGSAQQQIYNTDASGKISSFKPYTPYSANPTDYFAGPSPLQQQSYGTAANMQVPGQYAAATGATMGAMGALAGNQYNAGNANYLGTSAPTLNQYAMTGPQDVSGIQGGAAQLGAAPTSQGIQGGAAQLGATPLTQSSQGTASNMQAAQTGYNPNLQNFQMSGVNQIGTQDFNRQGTASAYMNPYLQQSLAPQLEEIQRQYGITGAQQQSGATKAGAFGGSREALMASENARNKNTAMNAAIGQGYNTAFTNAQQQFNTQQAASLQAQQANQQAGLTTGSQNLAANLGVQQLGAQTGSQMALANLGNQQQAAVQNQANQQGMTLANMQNQQQANLANQALKGQYGLQQGANQQGMTLANMQNLQQANMANQAMQGQYGLQQGANQQGMTLANMQNQQQANLANQQAGLATGQQNLQSALQTQGLGSGQNMQSQLANQQAYAGAQQANIGQQQFGANYGLQNLQQYLSGASQLGNLGTNQLAAQQGIMNAQNTMGGQQQAAQQNIINQAISNYATAQQYPMMQLGNMSNLLHGLPMASTSTQSYQAAPSMASQIGALGTGAIGLSKLAGKKGGLPKHFEKTKGGTGIDDLAMHDLMNYKE